MTDDVEVPQWIIEALGDDFSVDLSAKKIVEIVLAPDQKLRIMRLENKAFSFDYLLMISVAEPGETKNSAIISWRVDLDTMKRKKFSYVVTGRLNHDEAKKESTLFDYLRQNAPKIFEYFLWNKI